MLEQQRPPTLSQPYLPLPCPFLQGKVKRSYPLTAVEKVEYDNVQNPLLFKLVFSTYILSLQAESEEDARDWVEKINSGRCAENWGWGYSLKHTGSEATIMAL